MKLTKAEFDLINNHDYEIQLQDLHPLQRALVKRMRTKGLVSKRGIHSGVVKITQKGKDAWWKVYHGQQHS